MVAAHRPVSKRSRMHPGIVISSPLGPEGREIARLTWFFRCFPAVALR